MSNTYSMFKTDSTTEQTGIWLRYSPTMRIRVARSGGGNVAFAKALEAKSKPYRLAIKNEMMDNELGKQILIEVYAETVVLGWEGVTDERGKDLPHSRENVVKLLTDLPDLFQDIIEQSSKMALFRQQQLETEAGN
jgi:hypothetical protein